MVSTAVLLTTILAAFALIAGAFYALVVRVGSEVSGVSRRLEGMEANLDGRLQGVGARLEGMEARLDARLDGVEARLGVRLDGVEARLDGVRDELTVVRAAVGGLDSRVATLERRLGES